MTRKSCSAAEHLFSGAAKPRPLKALLNYEITRFHGLCLRVACRDFDVGWNAMGEPLMISVFHLA